MVICLETNVCKDAVTVISSSGTSKLLCAPIVVKILSCSNFVTVALMKFCPDTPRPERCC